jgi:hypothetical protein
MFDLKLGPKSTCNLSAIQLYMCTSCPWYEIDIYMYLYNCIFACTIVLPYPKVPIKISQWDLSKSNRTKKSSKYSPICKIYLGRLKIWKKNLGPKQNCWNHSKNIKSGLRIIYIYNIIYNNTCMCTHVCSKYIDTYIYIYMLYMFKK